MHNVEKWLFFHFIYKRVIGLITTGTLLKSISRINSQNIWYFILAFFIDSHVYVVSYQHVKRISLLELVTLYALSRKHYTLYPHLTQFMSLAPLKTSEKYEFSDFFQGLWKEANAMRDFLLIYLNHFFCSSIVIKYGFWSDWQSSKPLQWEYLKTAIGMQFANFQ